MVRWSGALALVCLVVFLAVLADLPCPRSAEAQLGGLGALYPWPEDPVNLVRNPSFEDVDLSGKPADWTLGVPSSLFVDTKEVHSGFRSLHLQDSHLAPYTPIASQPLALPPGWYNLRGQAKAVNAGTNAAAAGGRLSLWGTGVATGVVRGTTGWTTLEAFSISVVPGLTPTLRVDAYQKPDGDIHFDDVEVHRQVPPVVEGFLLYPNYRGALFEDRSQEISLSVWVRPEEAGETLEGLVVRLFLETESGLVVATRDVRPASGHFPLTLDASAAPLGRLRLRLQARRAGSDALAFEYPAYQLVKLSVAARGGLTTYVDTDNVLVMNGRRSFVLGIYDTTGYSTLPSYYEPRISAIAEAPINMYLNYWLGATPVSGLNALMTTLQKYGMTYLHTVNAWYSDNPDWPGSTLCGSQSANSLGQDAFTACMAAGLSSNPGLAGYYTADERRADQAERIFSQSRILRAADPDGVTFIAQMHPSELSRWRDATDVMGVDPYPIYNVPLGTLSPFQQVTDWVEQAQASVERSRPVWAVIQYFQFGSKGHFPTYDELRTMSYMAIVAGAKGLFYWSYGAKGLSWVTNPALKAEYWQRLVRVTREIKALEPALLSPDAPEILISHSPTGTIRVLAKRAGDTRYLIAVNNTPQNGVKAAFTLTAAGSVDVIEEGRTLPVSGTTFSDTFAPYQVHVYRITDGAGSPPPPPPPPPTGQDFRAGVYREATGQWLTVLPTGGGTVTWGEPGQGTVPVLADYDGDGKGDVATYRRSSAEWNILLSSGGSLEIQWGSPGSNDTPVPADYDGDGKADLAIYRMSTGEWFIYRSGGQGFFTTRWGDPALHDVPVAADYDGDGRADLAVYRPSTGEWHVRLWSGQSAAVTWGVSSMGDVPVPTDYDGDGKADLAVYRVSTGEWFIYRSGGQGFFTTRWGDPALQDVPVPTDVDGSGQARIVVYRRSTGQWFILGASGAPTILSLGTPVEGDEPVSLRP